MKLDAVLHIPMSEYAHGLNEKKIVYRIRCAKDDLVRVTLSYADTACRVTPILFTPVPMEKVFCNSLHDYWQVVVDSPYNRVYYYFELDDGKQTIFYYGDVFTNHLVDDRSQYFKLPFNHRADIPTVPDWVHDAVVYNIFPDSFATSKEYISLQPTQMEHKSRIVKGKLGGTLQGITENIDYLKELGITCVYINPIFAAGEYHKYDILDYFQIDPCFGGNQAFRQMVDVLHANGIRVIIDGVFNHCGWYFFAFEDVVKYQEKSAYCDWFYHLEFPVERPDNPEIYPTYACFAYERMMPKLNTSNPEVQNYLCKVGRYWVEKYDIDGWRLDVASEVDDSFWRAFRKTVKEIKPDALIIGEVWESANHWLNGDMFDSTMNYDFRKHCNLFFAEESMDALDFAGRIAQMLMRYRLQIVPAQLNLLDSHDVSRFLSLCKGDTEKYRLAILFLMTFIGMPTVLYGDELGIQGVTEEEYRHPMPWGNGDSALFRFFQKAIAMRRELSALHRGDFRILCAEKNSGLLIYQRTFQKQTVTIAINRNTMPVVLPLMKGSVYWAEKEKENQLAGHGFSIHVDERS